MTDMPTGHRGPSARYGRPPLPAATRRRVAMALAGLTTLLGLGVAVLGFQRFERSAVEGKAGVYEVLDGRTVSVTISVTRRDPSVPVVCIVRSKAIDGGETGRREILVGPSAERDVRVTTTVNSYRPSVMADVYGCGTKVPPYLTAP